MTPPSWLRVARLSELADDVPLSLDADGTPLVAVRHAGTVSVFEGLCPHQGSLLADGQVVAGQLVCPGHGWRFDCASGRRAGDPATCLHRFDTHIADDALYIDVDELRAFHARRAAHAPTARPLASLPGPDGLPLFGNLFQLRETRQHLILEQWADTFGPLYRLQLGPYRVMVVADPAVVQDAFKRRPDTFRRLGRFAAIAREVGADGVFTAEGDDWRRQRKVTTQALGHGQLKHFFPALMRITGRLRGRWERAADAGHEVDLLDDLTRFTIDVTSAFAFGEDLNTIDGHAGTLSRQLNEVPKALSRRAIAMLPYWRLFRLPADRALDEAREGLTATLARLTDDARRQIAEDPGLAARPVNYLQGLVAQQLAGEHAFSDENVSGNVMTLMLAGEETTARALAWLIYYMCEKPGLQAQLRGESDAVLGESGLLHDFADHPRMVLIEAAAHEAMRLKPPAPIHRLEALHDTTLGGIALPKGTLAFLLTRHATTREHADGDGGDVFDLQRWLDAEGKGVDITAAHGFFPFGAGPRFCPGRFLALLEIKAVISMLARNFEVERVDHGPVDEHLVVTMRPDNLSVRLRRRTVGAAARAGGA